MSEASIQEMVDEVIGYVDDFCAEHISEERVKNWCVSRGVSSAEYAAFYESELGRYCMPPALGGFDGPFLVRAMLVARLMRHAGAMLPYHSDMNSMALLSTLSEQSQREIIEDFTASDGRVSFSQAFSEGGLGADSSSIITEVTSDLDGVFLDGEKTFVANGQFAARTLVLAQDMVHGIEDGGQSLWLVPLSEAGVYTYPLNTVGQEMLAPARLVFDHVKLDPMWRIQTEGRLGAMLERQYMLGRIYVCAASLGLAQAAMDDALERCARYRTRGRYLSSISQIQVKLANMAVEIRSMENLVTKAALSVSSDDSLSEQKYNCALMKHYVPGAATQLASEALQIFGGMGYTDESRVSRIWRDCRGNQIAQGADEMMSRSIARHLVKEYAFTKKDL